MSLFVTNLWILFSYSFKYLRWVIHLTTLSFSFYVFCFILPSLQLIHIGLSCTLLWIFGSLDLLTHLGLLDRVLEPYWRTLGLLDRALEPYWCLFPISIVHHWRMSFSSIVCQLTPVLLKHSASLTHLSSRQGASIDFRCPGVTLQSASR